MSGGAAGIGREISVHLARAGGHIINAGRNEQALQALQTEIGGEYIVCDLSNAEEIEKEISQIAPVHHLVNNAGIIKRNEAIDFTPGEWDAVMDVNLRTLFFLSQAFARHLVAEKKSGKIINIASMLTFQGGIRVAAYTASKHGVAGLTKTLANEWAAKGVNVNAIAPGYIATNNTAALRADTARNAAILDRIPAGHWGQPEDISGTAVYLCSPAASYVHGTILNVDGGWLAR